MAAGPSAEQAQGGQHLSSALCGPTSLSEVPMARRVVSVSPHPTNASCQTDLSHLMYDLTGLIAEARSAGRALHALTSQQRKQESLALAASNQLQDRLLLAARMLQAMQTQIDRVELALSKLSRRSPGDFGQAADQTEAISPQADASTTKAIA